MASFGSSFFRELKRRRVLRTCVLYVGVWWLVIQMAEILAPSFGLDWEAYSKTLLGIAAMGFPFMVSLAWVVQFSTKGIVRTPAFVERRVLSNIPPINDRRQTGVTQYFNKDESHPEYEWILSAETGPLAGLSFGVAGPLVLGRSLESDVAVVSQHVSRQHARLNVDENGQLTVEDMDSSNGTIVNGKAIEGLQFLHHEDELRFHDIIFRVSQSYSGLRDEMDSMNRTQTVDLRELEDKTTWSKGPDT